jgi:acyl carrier protein
MSETSTQTRLEAVRAWLQEKNPTAGPIGDDVNLIDNRLVDSLRLVEFLFLLESLTGRDIPAHTVKVDQFRTIAAIERNFLVEPADR